VFVTSVIYRAYMGGVAGADERCQARADAAGLGGVWRAWLSDTTSNAADRLSHSDSPYVLLDGTRVADNWADLTDGTLDHVIDLTEIGSAPPRPSPFVLEEPTVWTGSTPAGMASPGVAHCMNWTAGGGSGHTMTEGRTDRADSAWTNSRTWSGGPCSWERPLYCFEQ